MNERLELSNKSKKLHEVSNLLGTKIGSYGGYNETYYNYREFIEIRYLLSREKEGYEIPAIVNEIYDMWYKS